MEPVSGRRALEVAEDVLSSNGFWFAIGVFAGIFVDVVVRGIVIWWNRPILISPSEDGDQITGVWLGPTAYRAAGSLEQALGRVVEGPLRVWRLKVRNRENSAAENVRGTLRITEANGLQGERRLPWYEPPRNFLILNREDHSYLDLYGVAHRSGAPAEICFPTEEGWGDREHPISGFNADRLRAFELRITARNCDRLIFTFRVDANQNFTPVLTAVG